MDPTARVEPRVENSLREHVGIETPEHVALRLELAGVGSRATAAMIDTVVAVARRARPYSIIAMVIVGVARWSPGLSAPHGS